MEDEQNKHPTTFPDETQTQVHLPSQTLEVTQPLEHSESILVSEDEYGLPLPSTGKMIESESLPPASNQHKKQEGQKEKKKKKRHGARNQHRHKFFVKWLLSKFDLEKSKSTPLDQSTTRVQNSDPNVQVSSEDNGKCSGKTNGNGHDKNTTKALHETGKEDEDHSSDCTCSTTISSEHQELHILDVAGGKGEVAARLTMCHQQRVVMVDPRPADIVDCFERIVLPKIPNKWQRRLEGQREKNPDFVRNVVNSRFRQLVTTFDDHKIMCDPTQDMDWSSMPKRFGSRSEIAELQTAIQNATLIVGLHADGATEAIVDAALKYQKPFVVVPCCVFPNFFPMRRLVIDQKDGNTPRSIPVRSHEQFCQFLLQKDPRFVMEELPFEGRNIAIWWDGK